MKIFNEKGQPSGRIDDKGVHLHLRPLVGMIYIPVIDCENLKVYFSIEDALKGLLRAANKAEYSTKEIHDFCWIQTHDTMTGEWGAIENKELVSHFTLTLREK